MNSKKIISVLLTLAFTCNVASKPVFGAAVSVADNRYDINKNFSVSGISGTGKNLVVLVQDLHCHYDTQIKISELLKNISKQDNFNKIFVEGASRNVTSSFIRTLPASIREPLTENLLKDGKIGGGVYFYLKNEVNVPLYALEDEELYNQNAKRLEYIFGAQKEVNEILSELQEELKILQRKHLSANSRKMLAAVNKYEKGKLSPVKYYKYLVKEAGKHGISLDKYGKIAEASEIDAKINEKKLNKELAAYMDNAKKTLPYQTYKELAEGDIIKNIAKSGASLSEYKELSKYIALYEYERESDFLKLYAQEKSLFTELLIKTAKNEEIETIILSLAFGKLKNVMENKATDAEFRYVKEFGIENIRKAWDKLSDTATFERMLPYFYKYNDYYSANEKRDYVFADKIYS
ncbi:MAG: hypothetical protein FWC57_00785, partial [Endomicrobia bacterium]|nr:hypothetical protein [Endomicrobiia bacterium]